VSLEISEVGITKSSPGFDFLQQPDLLICIPNLLSNGYRRNSPPRIKRHELEADHSPPSSAVVKKDGAIPPVFHTPSWHNA
jgi:hypothetical protein